MRGRLRSAFTINDVGDAKSKDDDGSSVLKNSVDEISAYGGKHDLCL